MAKEWRCYGVCSAVGLLARCTLQKLATPATIPIDEIKKWALPKYQTPYLTAISSHFCLKTPAPITILHLGISKNRRERVHFAYFAHRAHFSMRRKLDPRRAQPLWLCAGTGDFFNWLR
jgi:hypothetical protein